VRIGVDLCNTVANVNAMLAIRFTGLSLTSYPSPGIPEGFFTTLEGLEVLKKAPPFSYAAGTLRFLASAGHEVIYLTSRSFPAANLTREWLSVNGFPRGMLMFLPRGYKAMFARHYWIDWFFEDDPLEVLSLQGVVGQVFVKTWAYNYNAHGPGVKKFTSWREIMSYAAAEKWDKAGAFA